MSSRTGLSFHTIHPIDTTDIAVDRDVYFDGFASAEWVFRDVGIDLAGKKDHNIHVTNSGVRFKLSESTGDSEVLEVRCLIPKEADQRTITDLLDCIKQVAEKAFPKAERVNFGI